MLSTLKPVVTVTLASLLLGETLGWLQWLGRASVLGAVLWLVRSGGGAPDDAVRLEANQ